MSKKKTSKKKARRAGKKVTRRDSSVANAYASLLRGGDYSSAIAAKALSAQNEAIAKAFGDATKALHVKPPPKPRKPRASKPKETVVTAEQVVKAAVDADLKRWLCQGPKRTGCGSTGRVTSGKGTFVRLRPPKFLKA